MKAALLGSLVTLLAGAGLALGQTMLLPPPSVAPPDGALPYVEPGVEGPADIHPPHADLLPGGPPVLLQPPGPLFYVNNEYLLWWIKDDNSPPLLATGLLNRPGTVVVFDGSDLSEQQRQGGRLTAGVWLDEYQMFALEGRYLFLTAEGAEHAFGTNGAPGTPLLTRPFFNVRTQQENAGVVAFPGFLAGSLVASASSRLQGAEANLVMEIVDNPGCRLDFVTGFRFLRLDEDLDIFQNTRGLRTGLRTNIRDRFDTRNEFFGGQIGAKTTCRWRSLSFEVLGLLGFGQTNQVLQIDGATGFLLPGRPPLIFAGGLLALPTNSFRSSENDFSVIPELNLTLAWQVTPRLRLSVGYTAFYWSDLIRPGDQVDLVLNDTQIPSSQFFLGRLLGPARPTLTRNDTDFWAHGISGGIEFRY